MVTKALKDMTKAELLGVIERKLGKLKPQWRRNVMRGLKYQTKAELRHKASRMRVEVDKGGYDISWY